MISAPYRNKIHVLPEHIDDLNHVNNVVYLQWAQEAAQEHWLSKSSEEINARYYWVVVDHFIEYKGPAYVDQSLDVVTYVEEQKGVCSTRIVEFLLEDKLLVRVKTSWCLVDRRSHRPTRIPQEINDLFFK